MNHKKTLASLLMLFVLAFSVILPAAQPEDAAAADIQVFVNGQYLSTDQPPVIQDGRTMVPLRAIFEALGAQVEYFADTRTVSGYDPQTNRIMSLVLDQKTLFCADYTLFQVYEANLYRRTHHGPCPRYRGISRRQRCLGRQHESGHDHTLIRE